MDLMAGHEFDNPRALPWRLDSGSSRWPTCEGAGPPDSQGAECGLGRSTTDGCRMRRYPHRGGCAAMPQCGGGRSCAMAHRV